MPDLTTIKTLVRGYADLRDRLHGERVQVLASGISRIRSCMPELRARQRDRNALGAPDFNVYRILRLERKEVAVHTPTLGELLDPEGTHAQGFLFLRAFFDTSTQRGLAPPAPGFENLAWYVETEKYAGAYGNLDIVVSCRSLGYLLAIENKIGAGEQTDQLWRYAQWLKAQRHNYTTRQLIFLTPSGREAETARQELHICLSYHSDIRMWLASAVKQVKASSVKEVLRQYMNIIQNC